MRYSLRYLPMNTAIAEKKKRKEKTFGEAEELSLYGKKVGKKSGFDMLGRGWRHDIPFYLGLNYFWMPISCYTARNRRKKRAKGTPLGTPTSNAAL